MNKHTKVTFSLLLVVCMLISGTPIATPAIAVGADNQASEPITETLPVEAVETDAAVLRDEAIIVKEDTTLRGEYEKHFLMSDGSYQVALYNEPVHKIAGEEWVEIDNTLTLKTATDGTARYETTDGLADVSFAKSFDDQLITMQQDDYSVSWGVQAFSSNLSMNQSAELVAPIQAELVNSELYTFSAEEQKTLATKSSSTIRYRNALQQSVDLEYVVLPSRVKENIILQSAQDITYYVVTVYTENLFARLLENREIELYNDNDEVIFTMTSPYMYDSVGELSEDITVEMVSNGDGCYSIKMVPNFQWLSDASRVYPVVIDPQVSVDTTRTNIIDNYVLEGAGVQNRNLDRLYIGNRSEGRTRAFIKYDTMPTLPLGTIISSATMTLFFTNGTDTAATANAYQVGSDWESETITWANMPNLDTLQASNISHNNVTQYRFSCLEAVKEWYTNSTLGRNQNYGIMLRYYDETVNDYNAVYSADHTDESKRPSLVITYEGTGGGANFASAKNIYLDDSVKVRTVCENEERYFKFVPPVNGVYLFYSSNASSGSDPFLQTYTASQVRMVSNDNGGGNKHFKLSITLVGGTTYYIGVKHAGTSYGSFDLNILISAPDVSVSGGHLRNIGSSMYVDIHGPGEQKFAHQWTYHGDAQARWTIAKQSNGSYSIQSAYGNKYYLGISDTNIETNNVVLCSTSSYYTSWNIYAKSTGELFIEPRNAPGKVLYVPNNGVGTELQLTYISSSSTSRNKWKIEFRSNTTLEGQRWSQWCWATSTRMFENHYLEVPNARTQNNAVSLIKGSVVNHGGSYSEAEAAANYYSTGNVSLNTLKITSEFQQIFSDSALRSILDNGHVVYITRGWYALNNARNSGHAYAIVGYSTIFENGSMSSRYIVYDPWPASEPLPWNTPQTTTGQSYFASYTWICNGRSRLLGDPVSDIGIWEGYIVLEEAHPGTTIDPFWN